MQSGAFYLNAQSLVKNRDSIEIFANKYNPELIFLSETHVTTDIEDCEININGYETIRCDSHSRFTGGVVIFVKKHIKYSVVFNKNFVNNVWILSIKVKNAVKPGIYSVLYHSPSESAKEFLDIFENWLDLNLKCTTLNVIVGDFNINLLRNDTYSNRLEKIISFYGLKQLIRDPTRITQNTTTLIDLCITNYFELEASVLHTPRITDHSIINIKVKKQITNNKETRIVKCYKNYSKINLCEQLKIFNWSAINNMNLDEQCDFLINCLQTSASKIINSKTIYINNCNKWFNLELKKLKEDKTASYLKARLSFDDELWKVYTTSRNRYDYHLKDTKNRYIQEEIEKCGKNQKQIWKTLKKEVLPCKLSKSTTFDIIEFGGEKESDVSKIAERFNAYFIESIMEINNSILVTSSDYYELTQVKSRFKFQKIHREKLETIISRLKITNDENNINSKLIWDSLEITHQIFINIINNSFEIGCFPKSWKESTIIPIQKKIGTRKCDEFRPINTLPSYEKLLECEVKDQLQNYIDSNEILAIEQSGFRKLHSCETALNLVISDWKFLRDEGNITIVVFLDLKRAFETLDRDRLLRKLQSYGVEGVELQWFSSYLAQRTQKTKVGEVFSSFMFNNLGVPQGSVLGPILFILYINDFGKVLKYCSCKFFADDTAIYISGKNINEIIWKLNSDLKNVSNWLNINKLKINVEKTVYIVIKNKITDNSEINVIINNTKLEQVSETKYLGIIIDDKLDFKKNLDYVVKKMSKKINFLSRISNKLTPITRTKIYTSIVASHIEFCSSILFLSNETDLKKLQLLQNRGMRILLGCNKYTSIKSMLDCLGWMTIKQRVNFNTIVLIYKIINNLLPNYLTNKINYVKDGHNYNLRTNEHFKLKFFNNKKNENNLYYKGMQMYNKLPIEIKNAKNIKSFKLNLSPYVKKFF